MKAIISANDIFVRLITMIMRYINKAILRKRTIITIRTISVQKTMIQK